MKPPYTITAEIISLISSISEKIGVVNATYLDRPSPHLRKSNRVRTIRASLEIEGNQLSEEQITAIIENKRVLGPQNEILEVKNAIAVYDLLPELNPHSSSDFLRAHGILMQGLDPRAGSFRNTSVGITKGSKISHVAPPADRVGGLMHDLLGFVSNSADHPLITSCAAHYEIEFIHPFTDGNGRMGRLWQTLLLMQHYRVFQYLPFETIIKEHQEEYYEMLEVSDRAGESTKFITFILSTINDSLAELLGQSNPLNSSEERISYFLETFEGDSFSRKDFMKSIKNISSATASRDLRYAVEKGLIIKFGDKRNARYSVSQVQKS